jgi:hypothetical protein
MEEIDPPEDIDNIGDLESYLGELAAAHNDLVHEVNRIDNLVVGALENSREAGDDVEALRGEVSRLRDQVELVDATMPAQQKSKLAKIRDILEFGMTEATGGRGGVKVTTGEAAAAAGASRDTARRLMDEIGANFSWAEVKTPGGPNPKELRLAIRGRDLDELMDDVRGHYGGASA